MTKETTTQAIDQETAALIIVDQDDLRDVADFFHADITDYADMHGYSLS